MYKHHKYMLKLYNELQTPVYVVYNVHDVIWDIFILKPQLLCILLY